MHMCILLLLFSIVYIYKDTYIVLISSHPFIRINMEKKICHTPPSTELEGNTYIYIYSTIVEFVMKKIFYWLISYSIE